MDAELRDVAAEVAHARTEQQRNGLLGVPLDDDMRGLRGEDSAAGESADVVQEALRAVDGAVLIVNAAVGCSR